jgi:hypothetical protein
MARGIDVVELLAGLLLSLTAAVVGVWQITKRDRPLHGPTDDGTLGLPRIQRWDVSYRPPRMQRLRSRFPRFEISRVVIGLSLIIVIATGAAIGYSRWNSQSVNQAQAFETGMTKVAERREEAMRQRDLSTAYAMLVDARAQLDALAAEQPDASAESQVTNEYAAIDEALTRLSGARHLSTIQTVGSVPAAPDGVTTRMAAGGGRVFLLSDAVYQVDVAGSSLIVLLEPGDVVGGSTVGTLRMISWREDRLLAADEERAYILDPATASWSAEPFGTFDDAGFTDIVAGEAYDFNLYLLAPDSGQILKFTAGLYDSPPEDWTNGFGRSDLEHATDLAIDGSVWVLLDDGRIMQFFRSRLEATLEPEVVPPLGATYALYASAGSNYLHLLNSTDGRILRLTRDGRVVQQFVPGDEPSPMTGATDLVVDESTHIAYVLASNTLYTIRLPEEPDPASPTATPRTN